MPLWNLMGRVWDGLSPSRSSRQHNRRLSRIGRGPLRDITACEERILLVAFSEFVDPHPSLDNQFGAHVIPLSTGNVVITSPYDDAGGTDAGAVYLFNGATGALISTLLGSQPQDLIGSNGATELTNGNYVVQSPNWHNGSAAFAGAVTWGNGVTGVSGVVSTSNSLVGGAAGSFVGFGFTPVMPLSNGNYLVRSDGWNNGSASAVGAVTWGSGTTGITGVISAANSLVGSSANDAVGFSVYELKQGNYVVNVPYWDKGSLLDVGAVVWGSSTSGVTGVISAANGLIGSTAGDRIGMNGVTLLDNGNYVIPSRYWDNGAIADVGAVTWGAGATGVKGAVSATNSLVGQKSNDQVGIGGVFQLANGNYVASSYWWDNGAITDAGAVTWGNGTTGISGVVSAANSLIGSSANDNIGSGSNARIQVLANGNYVVSSGNWNNGAVVDAGAVTWGNGAAGVQGTISATNSLIGDKTNDRVGMYGIVELSSGHFVARSPYWGNGTATSAGAVTWMNGTTGRTGIVSSTNSLVGSSPSDQVGLTGVFVLSNGHYVIPSPDWDNGATANVGAVTWGNGTTGITGAVSTSNSLVGAATSNRVGGSITPLTNGNYVVVSPAWDNGAVANVGAITWVEGSTAATGTVTAANSLIASSAEDQLGWDGFHNLVMPLRNGHYVVRSPQWDNGAATDAGAVTWGNGTSGVTGVVSSANSLVGSTSSDRIGEDFVELTGNSHYVVWSTGWDGPSRSDAGAATWGNGTSGVAGVVSPANSLVGANGTYLLGFDGVFPLSNGNYVVKSSWGKGAITWGSGSSGVHGEVSASNSFGQNVIFDGVENAELTILDNGHYLIRNSDWDIDTLTSAGAVTWGDGLTGVVGNASSSNSLLGQSTNTGLQKVVIDQVNNLFMGRFVDEEGGRVRVGNLGIGPLNGPPTGLNFANAVPALAEDVSTATRIKVADIQVVDDGRGINQLSLSGADAGAFEIIGSVLYLRANVAIDFEVKSSYIVTVSVDDVTVGVTPDASRVFTLAITDANDAPTFTAGPRSFVVDEYSTRWTLIGRVSATDVDPLDTLTYSIVGGNSDGALVIGDGSKASNAGKIWVNRRYLIGLRDRGSFSLKVRVTDNGTPVKFSEVDINIDLTLAPRINTRVNPTVDGTVLDVTGNGFTSADTLNSSGTSLLVQGGTTPSRSILEFQLPTVRTNQVLKNAWLYVNSSQLVGGATVNVPVSVFGYAGDGTLTASDAALGTQIGSRTITNSGGVDALHVFPIELDATFVRSLMSTGKLGLVLRNSGSSDGVAFDATESSVAAAQLPYLALQFGEVAGDVLVRDVGPTGTGNELLSLKSNLSSFSAQTANVFATGAWERFLTGDFNGDGQSDLAGRLTSNGEWWISLANGAGVYQTATKWGKWSPTLGMVDINIADLDGDFRADLVGRTATGTWLAYRSTGAGFTSQTLGTWSTATTWSDIQVGDFNRDGRDDIAGRNATSQWFVSVTNGPVNAMTQTTSQWGAWKATSGWTDIKVGDFNGDGFDDIIGRTSIGEWWASESNGASFEPGFRYGAWSTSHLWSNVRVGDFNGDGRDDLVGFSNYGQWYVSESAPTKFVTKLIGTWSQPLSQWGEVLVGDFNRDGRADLVRRNVDTNHLWTSLWTPTGFTTTDWVTLPDPANHTWRLLNSVRLV